MKPVTYITHANGYRTPVIEGAPLPELPADAVDIVALMDRYRKEYHLSTTWPFHEQVIRVLKRYISDFRAFFDAQESNNSITQAEYDFLSDTAQFIMTGNRSISIGIRGSLIASELDNHLSYSANQVTPPVSAMFGTTSNDELYIRWLTHDEGVRDILCTLIILFGDIKKSGIPG